MRLLMLAPMLLLAPTAEVATAAQDVAAPSHTLCGDDPIAPSVERILPGYGGSALKIAAKPQAQASFDMACS